MNRDELEKILPSEYKSDAYLSDDAIGYNRCRQACIDALLKAGVGLVPRLEQLTDCLENTKMLYGGYLKRDRCVVLATALRALMLSNSVNVPQSDIKPNKYSPEDQEID